MVERERKMAKLTVNIGTSANDRTGDNLRTAFNKINTNFTELYTALGLDDNSLNLGAFEFTGSVMTTTDSSAITIDQAVTVTSDLTVGGDVVPSTDLGSSLGSATKRFKDLYISNNTIFLGNTSLGVSSGGDLTVGGSSVSSVIDYNDIQNKPTLFDGAYASLSGTPTIPTATSDLTNDSGFLTSAPAPTVVSDKIIASQQELTTSFSYTATALTITVTPSSVTAPVFVTFNFNAVSKDTESDSNLNLQLYQDGVAVTDSELTQILMDDQSTTYATFPISYSYAFIPGTTSATVLTLYAKNGGGYRCMIGSSIGNTFQANAIVW